MVDFTVVACNGHRVQSPTVALVIELILVMVRCAIYPSALIIDAMAGEGPIVVALSFFLRLPWVPVMYRFSFRL